MSFEEKLVEIVKEYESVLSSSSGDLNLMRRVHSSISPTVVFNEYGVESFSIWLEGVGEIIREKSIKVLKKNPLIPENGQMRIKYNYEGGVIDSLDLGFYPYILPKVVDNNDGSKCFWRVGKDFIQRNESDVGLLIYHFDKGYFFSNRDRSGYCGMVFKAKEPCFDFIETFRIRRDLLSEGYLDDFLDLCDLGELTL